MSKLEQPFLDRIKFIGDGEFTLLGTPQSLLDELDQLIQDERKEAVEEYKQSQMWPDILAVHPSLAKDKLLTKGDN